MNFSGRSFKYNQNADNTGRADDFCMPDKHPRMAKDMYIFPYIIVGTT